MATELLDEQLVTQVMASTRHDLTRLRESYAGDGIKLSESAVLSMCIRRALPFFTSCSDDDLAGYVVLYAVLPGAERPEPLDEQLVAQETSAVFERLMALCARYSVGRSGNARLLKASVIRLCVAHALPELLRERGL